MKPICSGNGSAVVLAVLLLASGSHSDLEAEEQRAGTTPFEEAPGEQPEDMVRRLVEQGWGQQDLGKRTTPAIMRDLKRVEGGATVTVYFGTLCEDSEREVPRFLQLLDRLESDVPFSTTYVAVNQAKTEPHELLDGAQLLSLPTFVVKRDGKEVGRIVERSLSGLEVDLFNLLDSKSRGLVSASENVIRKYLDAYAEESP